MPQWSSRGSEVTIGFPQGLGTQVHLLTDFGSCLEAAPFHGHQIGLTFRMFTGFENQWTAPLSSDFWRVGLRWLPYSKFLALAEAGHDSLAPEGSIGLVAGGNPGRVFFMVLLDK